MKMIGVKIVFGTLSTFCERRMQENQRSTMIVLATNIPRKIVYTRTLFVLKSIRSRGKTLDRQCADHDRCYGITRNTECQHRDHCTAGNTVVSALGSSNGLRASFTEQFRMF